MADPGMASRLARSGMAMLEPEQGLASLGCVLSQADLFAGSAEQRPLTVTLANPFSWPQFVRSLPMMPTFFSDFADAADVDRLADATGDGIGGGSSSVKWGEKSSSTIVFMASR